MNPKTVQNNRLGENKFFFQGKQLLNTKLFQYCIKNNVVKFHFHHFLLLILFLVTSTVVADDWQQLRRAALERPRRTIADNDGMDAINFPKKLPATPKNFWKQRLDTIKGSKLDTLCYTPFTNAFQMSTPSRITEVYTGKPNNSNRYRNIISELHAQKTDPLALAIQFCRANNIEIFASVRVNDIHDAWMPRLVPQFKKEKPQLLLSASGKQRLNGAGIGLDFAHAEVRKRFTGIVCELLENYDVDGITLDFMRFPIFFQSTYQGIPATNAERKLLTGVIRQIRHYADKIGRKRGKYLPVAVRVHESPELCFYSAMDIECWMKEQLIDMVFAGSDRERFAPVSDMISLAQKYGVKAYVSVDTSWLKNKAPFQRGFKSALAQSMAALAAGADGIFYFNYFCSSRGRQELKKLICKLPKMDKLDKDYFLQYNPNTLSFQKEPGFRKIPDLLQNPLWLKPDSTHIFSMEIGDDFSQPAIRKLRPKLTLNVFVSENPGVQLKAMFNAFPLKNSDCRNGVYSFDVPPDAVKQGKNKVVLSLSAGTQSSYIILRGNELLVYRQNQVPWRRFYRAYGGKKSEKIINKSYRISDKGIGHQHMANFFYPLEKCNLQSLKVGFDLLVESSTAPEAVAVRIGNGKYVELVTFEPNQISFKYSEKSVKFKTNNRFHFYLLKLDSGRLLLMGDGKELLSAKLIKRFNIPKARLNPPITNPGQDFLDKGLFFGSLSAPGTGSARWKNITLYGLGFPVKDIGLKVRFSGKIDPALERAATTKLTSPLLDFRFNTGVVPRPKGLNVGYAPKSLTVTTKGTLILDNRNSVREYAYFRYRNNKQLACDDGVLIAEWKMRVLEEDSDKPYSFMSSIYAGASKKMFRAAFRLGATMLLTPGGQKLPIDGTQWHRFRLAISRENGKCLLLVDDHLVEETVLPQEKKYGASVGFGDGSSGIGGRIELEYYRVQTLL